MAENGVTERNSGGGLTWLWMVIAIVLIAAFMAWLAMNSEPTSIAVVEEDAAADTANADVPSVTLDEFGTDPSQYVGQTIRLTSVPVASRLGEQAIWTQLPNNQPYLIRLPGGFAAQSGQTLTVMGPVYEMSDSVLAAWQAEGVLADESQRTEAEFATTYLQATAAMPAGAQAR